MYPVVFDELRSRILGYSWSDKLEVHEIPAPTRISPFSVAIEGSVAIREDELGSGRLILLHDPSGSEAWQGTSRFVAMIRADVDPSMASDPLVGRVAWSWLTDSLESHHAVYHAEAGTVTSVVSRPFGQPAADPESNHIGHQLSQPPKTSIPIWDHGVTSACSPAGSLPFPTTLPPSLPDGPNSRERPPYPC